MEIADFITPEAIYTNVKAQDKYDVIKELSDKMAQVYNLDVKKIHTLLVAREELSSTAVDGGIAIPHARCSSIDRVYGFLAITEKGIDFDSPDGLKTKIFFVLISPENNSGLHLMALAKISRLFQDEKLKTKIISTKDSKQIFNILTGQ